MASPLTKGYHGNVVISGISCRLPDSDSMEEFRYNLMNNIDMVSSEPRRWKTGCMGLPERSGTLKDISKFDATFFNVHPKQADVMDPQLRNLLEITYEAIVDAGVNPLSIRGTKTGVFIGAQGMETMSNTDPGSPYVLTGGVLSMYANRISFSFDFKGPSLVCDTACSSGLYALDMALQNLRSGTCEAAIVGGTTLCLLAKGQKHFQNLGVLSPEGKCRSFDNDGDGYCRSEGIAAIYLQKEESARRVYCTILHSKVNCDGNKLQGITFPSSEVQKQLLQETYTEANIKPRDVAYVEAHATGTRAGDPEEAKAITEVICEGRDSPLLIGSVKSNIGHCESASGIASIAKVVVAMEGNIIPANLHFNKPNENIPGLTNGKLSVVSKNTKWSGGIVGINSFGFGGANAHVILRSNENEPHDPKDNKKPRLFVYAGRTAEGVEGVLEKAKKHPHDLSFHALTAETANMPTDTYTYRGFAVLNSANNACNVEKVNGEKPPVWFVFSGMGSQWSGMGKSLMDIEVFRNSIMKSDAILKPHGLDLFDMIMSGEALAADVTKAFVGITSIQVALVDLLTCIGIRPDGIVGHSVGELACAYADGSLTAEETVLAAYWRGHCVQNARLLPGGMAAVGLTWEEASLQCPPGVAPACHNSEESVTVSGPEEDVKRFVAELQSEQKFAKMVDSAGVAFHSHFMKGVADSLKNALEKVIVSKPRSDKWISSSFPESEWSSDIAKNSSADYHVHNLISPVLFHEALSHVPSNAVVIEIAPHCLLQSILKGSLGGKGCIVGLMKRNNPDNVNFLLSTLGRCYQNGVDLKPLQLLPPVKFPVPRGTPMISPLVKWDHRDSWHVLDKNNDDKDGSTFEIDLSKQSEYRYLLDHIIEGRPMLPAAVHFIFVWKALANREGKTWDQMPVHFENVQIHRAVMLIPDTKQHLEVKFIAGSDKFQVIERDVVVCSGTVRIPEQKVIRTYFNPDLDKLEHTKAPMMLTSDDLYKEFRLKGFEYGPSFQLLHGAALHGVSGHLKWTGNWITFFDTSTQLSILEIVKNLVLPRDFTCIIIDPAEHERKLQKYGTVLPLFAMGRGIRRTGGVHMHEVIMPYVSRTQQKPPEHQVYKFVPNIRQLDSRQLACHQIPARQCAERQTGLPNPDGRRFDPPQIDVRNDDMDTRETMLAVYAKLCETLTSHLTWTEYKNGINGIPVSNGEMHNCNEGRTDLTVDNKRNSENSHKVVCSGETEQPDTRRFSDTKQHSFLCLLREIEKTSKEIKFVELAKEVFETNSKDLNSDILLSNLQQMEFLKPCLDIVCSNLSSKNIRVLEICKAEMSKKCQECIPPFVSMTRCVATMDTGLVDQMTEDAPNIEIIDWEPGNKVPEPMVKFNLIVCDNVLRKQANLRIALKGVSEVLNEGGFVLIQEVTSEFRMGTLLDAVNSTGNTPKDIDDKDERSSGIYCDVATWRKIFSEEGLEIICEVSDVMLMSLFLLRKQKTNTVEKQDYLDLTTGEKFDWLNQLKSKVEEVSSRQKGENLWLISDDNYSGILGMVNCLRNEPGGDKLRCIFNMDGSPMALDEKTKDLLVKRDLALNVLKNGQWGSYSHLPMGKLPKVLSEDAFVNPIKRGDLSSLSWVQSPLKYERHTVTKNTEMCHVHYASLNFRDVMLATGKLSIDAVPGRFVDFDKLVGSEFSGVDSSGRRVMGMVPVNGLATRVKAEKRTLWSVPDDWTLEEAATVPVVYTTAFYALVVRGKISSDNTVLIHSGTGGVGQAAIRIALTYGCKVFTTVGTEEKRKYIKEKFPQLDDSCIFSSRDTVFELGIKAATNDRGVDIVLNSLAGDKLFASIRVLAQHGRFLEIGKYDLANNSALGMNVFLKNIAFHGILLDSLFEPDNHELDAVSRCLVDGIKTGVVEPLQTTVFDADNVEGAFRYMAKGKHIGKVLIKINSGEEIPLVPAVPRSYFYSDKAYIITGGLGGFGLELAEWLVFRGARSLILTSRSGVKTGYQRRKLYFLRESCGADVMVSNKNICSRKEVRDLFENVNGRPVGGVFHLAAVLKDAILENQTKENFIAVAEPKVTGTRNLDHVTRELCKETLDWFVTFSSTSSGYGNAGQSPYGYANSVMERLMERRKSDGLPGLAIQWGPVGDIGMFIENIGDNNTVFGGTTPQRILSCLNSLDTFLQQPEAVVCSYVTAEKSSAGTAKSAKDLVSAVCNILGAKDPSSVDQSKTLGDLGLDSLLTVELVLLLENDYHVVLSPKELREITINKLKRMEAESANRCDKKDGGEKSEEQSVGSTALVKDGDFLPMDVVLKMNNIEEGIPLFIVHDLFGKIILPFMHVASQLKVPVYGIQRTEEVPLDTIENMAAHYIQVIRNVCKAGPLHLAGFSFGCIVVQEMLLQLQASQYDVRSVFLLDGSTQFTKLHMAKIKSKDSAVLEDLNQNAAIHILKDMAVQFTQGALKEGPEYVETFVQTVIANRPDLSAEKLRIATQGTLNAVKWAVNYKPAGKYKGNINLIRAEVSGRYPEVTEDYGLGEFCSGNVQVDTVPGHHYNFTTGKSGDQVATIINSRVSSA